MIRKTHTTALQCISADSVTYISTKICTQLTETSAPIHMYDKSRQAQRAHGSVDSSTKHALRNEFQYYEPAR